LSTPFLLPGLRFCLPHRQVATQRSIPAAVHRVPRFDARETGTERTEWRRDFHGGYLEQHSGCTVGGGLFIPVAVASSGVRRCGEPSRREKGAASIPIRGAPTLWTDCSGPQERLIGLAAALIQPQANALRANAGTPIR
jgi:hypothetical protein